jgi:endogenous inhibitor of DNA gyrase (YacG/DUF329 family)
MPSDPVCVYCRRQPVNPSWAPFCSERCRMADLGRWLSGDYRAPAEEPPDAPDTAEGDESD